MKKAMTSWIARSIGYESNDLSSQSQSMDKMQPTLMAERLVLSLPAQKTFMLGMQQVWQMVVDHLSQNLTFAQMVNALLI
jgi:hypothetical protein